MRISNPLLYVVSDVTDGDMVFLAAGLNYVALGAGKPMNSKIVPKKKPRNA